MSKRRALRRRFSRVRDGVHDAPPTARAPLIVSAQFAERIAAGAITQHRLHAPRDLDADCRFVVGESYAVMYMEALPAAGYLRSRPTAPHRHGVKVCRIRVTGVRRQRLGDVTKAEARAEGYRDAKVLLAHWARARKLKHPERKQVWAVEFEVDGEHRPEWLARDSSRGYTDSKAHALEGEPEAVRPDSLDPKWAGEANARHRDARRDEDERKRTRRLVARVNQLRSQARSKGVDDGPEIEAIEDALGKLQRRLEAIA